MNNINSCENNESFDENENFHVSQFRKNLALKSRLLEIITEVKENLLEPILTIEESLLINSSVETIVGSNKLYTEEIEVSLEIYKAMLEFRKKITLLENKLDDSLFPCDKRIKF
jgi:hypothetical protein